MISDSAQMLNDFELNLKTTLRGDLHGADRGVLLNIAGRYTPCRPSTTLLTIWMKFRKHSSQTFNGQTILNE